MVGSWVWVGRPLAAREDAVSDTGVLKGVHPFQSGVLERINSVREIDQERLFGRGRVVCTALSSALPISPVPRRFGCHDHFDVSTSIIVMRSLLPVTPSRPSDAHTGQLD